LKGTLFGLSLKPTQPTCKSHFLKASPERHVEAERIGGRERKRREKKVRERMIVMVIFNKL